jgi:hypothetical protein
LLAQKLGIKSHHEIIDYTHAKQNLQEVIDKLPENLGSKKLAEIIADWKNHLWNGKHEEILSQIHSLIQSPTKQKAALKKFKNYFSDNSHRMQYSTFRNLGLPTKKWMRRECCPSSNQSAIKIFGHFLESTNRRDYALSKKQGNRIWNWRF